MRANLKFRERSFLSTYDQIYNYSDSIVTTLQHVCKNPECRLIIDSHRIIENAKSKREDSSQNQFSDLQFMFYCYNCANQIEPKLKVRTGRNLKTQQEKVSLFHPVELRLMVELNLAIDESYQSIRHRTIEEIRENSTLYWNLIYYFSQHDLPL